MLDRIGDLTDQIAAIAPKQPAQGQMQLLRDMHTFHDYVEALRAEYPVPPEDITSIRRPSSDKGNRPVIIDTAAGRRYTVYRGGRGTDEHTVTALPTV